MALTESSMVARGSPRGIAAERLLKVELAPSTTRPWKEMLRKSSPANWISSGLAFGRHKTGFDFFSRDRFFTINVCSSRPSLFFLKKKSAGYRRHTVTCAQGVARQSAEGRTTDPGTTTGRGLGMRACGRRRARGKRTRGQAHVPKCTGAPHRQAT